MSQELMGTSSLTVFFPAWNEEEGIARAIDAAVEACEDLVLRKEITEFEVLVVDDASTDRTWEIVEGYHEKDPRVRGVRHPENRKLGGALRTGFSEARGSTVLYTDADLPFDMAELVKAFRLMRHYDADIVAAYRHDRTGEGPRRLVYSYVYNSLIQALLGLRVRDVNFAAKLVKRRVLDTTTLKSSGSFIDVELLAKAERQGYQIIQFGVDYFPRSRGVSTLSSGSVIVTMLKELIALVPEIRAVGPRTKPN